MMDTQAFAYQIGMDIGKIEKRLDKIEELLIASTKEKAPEDATETTFRKWLCSKDCPEQVRSYYHNFASETCKKVIEMTWSTSDAFRFIVGKSTK